MAEPAGPAAGGEKPGSVAAPPTGLPGGSGFPGGAPGPSQPVLHAHPNPGLTASQGASSQGLGVAGTANGTRTRRESAALPPAQQLILKYGRLYRTYLDKTVIFPRERWIFFFCVLALYVLRVYLLDGFFIVTYALGIYLLNLVIGFLSPQFDPEDELSMGGGGDNDDILPMDPGAAGASSAGMQKDFGGTTDRETGEFRPFSRKLPEFKFWVMGTKAVLICIGMTFFSFFDLPVFWPILLGYFILLVFITMKERIKHMIKYKYLPFSLPGSMGGKQTYRDMSRVNVSGASMKAGGRRAD